MPTGVHLKSGQTTSHWNVFVVYISSNPEGLSVGFSDYNEYNATTIR